MEKAGIPVAQYLRMSTEKQEYSLVNQSATMVQYAKEHGYQIVKTYTDAGKTGLTIANRTGLRHLLNDVVNCVCEFKAILVYDVSRWGRFQDVDEAAHYEYLCKSAGIPVIYCAEEFGSDGSMPASIMKALKRAMAAEYSRELGVKVYTGLKRLAEIGFKQGGAPGYGLRRMLVSSGREPKQMLKKGERKSIVNDRVILVPGPADEVEIVREMYQMFINGRFNFRSIARELNRRGIRFVDGGEWDHQTVRTVLTHPKYAGFNVFGRTAQKLHGRTKLMPKSEWCVTPNAFEPVVSPSVFLQAQHELLQRAHNRSDRQLLDDLRSLLKRKGRLSARIISNDPNTVSPGTYCRRFGCNLAAVYALLGYTKPLGYDGMIETRERIHALRCNLVDDIVASNSGKVKAVRCHRSRRKELKVGRTRVMVLMGRCYKLSRNALRWQAVPCPRERHGIALLCRLNEGNHSVRDCFILPKMDRLRAMTLTKNHTLIRSAVRLDDLAQFATLVNKIRAENRRTRRS